jgi:predicted DsbA family dithiol-disulfide isomerase
MTTTTSLRIDMWADVICPWCGLGDHRLRRALASFGHPVEVIRHSFQLDPSVPEGIVRTSREMLAEKGYDPAQVAASTDRIEAMAAEEGLDPYRVGAAMAGSTAMVHEVLAHATATGRGDQAWEAVYRVHFGEGRDIFTVDGLVAVAPELGLSADDVRAVLADRRYREAVVADQQLAARLGVRGVPFFVVDSRYGLSGAQPTETLLDALRKAWSERELTA